MLERLFDLPLSELGPRPEDFAHRSRIHGPGHACRVQALSVVLCRAAALERELPGCFAAAFLHDLARRDDGVCTEHGRWAVEEKLELHLPFFRRLGVEESQVEAIRTAVANHSITVELSREHPHFALTAVLKDADALDRWRIGERPGLGYLRLAVTPTLVDRARELFLRTRSMQSLECIWPVVVEVFGQELGMGEPTTRRLGPRA